MKTRENIGLKERVKYEIKDKEGRNKQGKIELEKKIH